MECPSFVFSRDATVLGMGAEDQAEFLLPPPLCLPQRARGPRTKGQGDHGVVRGRGQEPHFLICLSGCLARG